MTKQEYFNTLLNFLSTAQHQTLYEHLDKIMELKNALKTAEEKIKEYIKYNNIREDKVGEYIVRYSKNRKLKPVDINLVLKEYPLEEYKDIYNITLSAKAKKVITNPELVKFEEYDIVRIQKVKDNKKQDNEVF